MTATHKNRLVTTISAVASSGLGALTISTASSGYRTFGAGDDGLTFDGITITEGMSWERRDGCVYTHSGTSLARGTLADSSTGSAIAFTAAAIVTQGGAAEFAAMLQLAMASTAPGGRLTLESGVPVSTTDQTAKTSIYYTPYVSNVVPLWDGYKWVPVQFTEKTLALGTLTNGKVYDVFGYLSSGALVLELGTVWASDTARATGSGGVSLQDGRYCKGAAGFEDKTRLLLGTFYTASTTTTEDSAGGAVTQTGGKRFLWNAYNRVRRHMAVIDTTNSWTYDTATWRQANAAGGNKVEFVCGIGGAAVSAFLNQSANAIAGGYGYVGIGLNTTSGTTAPAAIGYASSGSTDFMMPVKLSAYAAAGYSYIAWNEYGGGATFVRYGDNGESGLRQSHMTAEVWS